MAKKSSDYKSMAGKLSDVVLTTRLLPDPKSGQLAQAALEYALERYFFWLEVEAKEEAQLLAVAVTGKK